MFILNITNPKTNLSKVVDVTDYTIEELTYLENFYINANYEVHLEEIEG